MEINNIFTDTRDDLKQEIFEILYQSNSLKLERIISSGQSTPEGQWYDQETDEWVLLLSGSATLLFDGELKETHMYPGDYILIPAHKKHRVTSTNPRHKTIWLTLHAAP